MSSSGGRSSRRKRRKRKWDVMVPEGEAGVGDADPHAAAMAAATRLNAMLAAKGAIKVAPDQPYSSELEINHCPPGVRYQVTKGATHQEIMRETGATIVVRGKFKKPGDTSPKPPLHLLVSADDQRKVDAALARLNAIINKTTSFTTPFVPFPGGTYVETKVDLGIDPSGKHFNAFNFVGKIIGPKGANVKYIENTTGAKVQLKGGPARQYPGQPIDPTEKQEDMNLHLCASSQTVLDSAKKLAQELVDSVRKDYEEFIKEREKPPPPSYPRRHEPPVGMGQGLGQGPPALGLHGGPPLGRGPPLGGPLGQGPPAGPLGQGPPPFRPGGPLGLPGQGPPRGPPNNNVPPGRQGFQPPFPNLPPGGMGFTQPGFNQGFQPPPFGWQQFNQGQGGRPPMPPGGGPPGGGPPGGPPQNFQQQNYGGFQQQNQQQFGYPPGGQPPHHPELGHAPMPPGVPPGGGPPGHHNNQFGPPRQFNEHIPHQHPHQPPMPPHSAPGADHNITQDRPRRRFQEFPSDKPPGAPNTHPSNRTYQESKNEEPALGPQRPTTEEINSSALPEIDSKLMPPPPPPRHKPPPPSDSAPPGTYFQTYFLSLIHCSV
eukprot:CAMPEP_0174250072 /NCGR_PEP_ID=MMETSP0439-20130205/361_1 /TAXON_ID=0 /ORGANISM="Stereomyxa ramosa, Strain Chinc5" /LENGTH=598 /DNA_ID=CAMNT_0015330055 /DNA_START=1 /DNA_END=1797 /DNA_ORIENTATION=+